MARTLHSHVCFDPRYHRIILRTIESSMKCVVAGLLLTAIIEVAAAASWDWLLTAEENCNVENAGVCLETVFWLTDSV